MTASDVYLGSTHVVVAEVLDALVNSRKALSRLETLRGYRTRSLLLSVDAPEAAARYDNRVSEALEDLALSITDKLRQAVPS